MLLDRLLNGILAILDVAIGLLAGATAAINIYLMAPGGDSPTVWTHMFGWLATALVVVRLLALRDGKGWGSDSAWGEDD